MFYLPLLSLLLLQHVCAKNFDALPSDVGCHALGLSEDKEFRPGVSKSFGISFTNIEFRETPRILVSVGYGTSEDTVNIPESYDMINRNTPATETGCPLSFTASITHLSKTGFAVGVARQLATSTSDVMKEYSRCFFKNPWPAQLRVCWAAWAVGEWELLDMGKTIREGTVWNLHMDKPRVDYTVTFKRPFDPNQILNVQITIQALKGMTDPMSYSVSAVSETGFTVHVGLASGNPPTGSPTSTANEFSVHYLVQASENISAVSPATLVPRQGMYDVFFERLVCNDDASERFNMQTTGVWMLFKDCSQFPSAQRMELVSTKKHTKHLQGGSSSSFSSSGTRASKDCEIYTYGISIPNGHDKLQASFSNYPWWVQDPFINGDGPEVYDSLWSVPRKGKGDDWYTLEGPGLYTITIYYPQNTDEYKLKPKRTIPGGSHGCPYNCSHHGTCRKDAGTDIFDLGFVCKCETGYYGCGCHRGLSHTTSSNHKKTWDWDKIKVDKNSPGSYFTAADYPSNVLNNEAVFRKTLFGAADALVGLDLWWPPVSTVSSNILLPRNVRHKRI